ncbi:MAG TPA: DUF362 domain-containing protein [Dissulfurispiraceae bacterium]|nr:DUF362 domain-containing protein [Dissulfurispiraceae bacterium]
MNRRDFLKTSALAGIGLSIPLSVDLLIDSCEAAAGTDIIVATGANPGRITRAAVDALGGMKRFISKGDVVVVKPNIGWDRLPEHAATTNPDVVAAVVLMCFEAGAKKVKVFDRTVNDPRRCYIQSGIYQAARNAGADVSYVDERRFKDTAINGLALKTWPLYEDILNADKVINVPVAKHHSLSKLTMSMKNWMGIMGGSRSQIHQRIDESLVDVSRAIKPALTVLDAVRILTRNGPQGGNPADVKKLDTVVVGIDQVAVDSYGATLFGMKGSDLGYVRIADKSGLGTMDLSKVRIKKISA